jgi:hypothetical protein
MPAWVDGALSWIEAAQVDAAMDGGRHVEAFFLNKGEGLTGSTKLPGEFFCAHLIIINVTRGVGRNRDRRPPRIAAHARGTV